MNDEVDRLNKSVNAIKDAEHEEKLPLSLEERLSSFWLACCAAAAIEHDRRLAGLPESQPEPWPLPPGSSSPRNSTSTKKA